MACRLPTSRTWSLTTLLAPHRSAKGVPLAVWRYRCGPRAALVAWPGRAPLVWGRGSERQCGPHAAGVRRGARPGSCAATCCALARGDDHVAARRYTRPSPATGLPRHALWAAPNVLCSDGRVSAACFFAVCFSLHLDLMHVLLLSRRLGQRPDLAPSLLPQGSVIRTQMRPSASA